MALHTAASTDSLLLWSSLGCSFHLHSAWRFSSGESRWNKTSSIPDETPTFPPITPKHHSRSVSTISHCSALGVCNEEWDCVCVCMCTFLCRVCVCVFLRVMRNGRMWVGGGGRECRGSAEGIGLGEQVCLFDVLLQREEGDFQQTSSPHTPSLSPSFTTYMTAANLPVSLKALKNLNLKALNFPFLYRNLHI